MAVTWSSYRDSIGDRSGLFAAILASWGTSKALYPGSYVDLSPSTAIPSVTYIDSDRRAARFFADDALVRADLEGRTLPGAARSIRFVDADYAAGLPLPDAGFDLLISLYAGPVWDHCGRHLAHGGLLIANTSHGDASLAALHPALTLVAAVHSRGDSYRVLTDRLDRYLVPRKPARADPRTIRREGRGIGYTVTAFAYIFQLARPPQGGGAA